jgi:hypothetical protein
MSWEGLRLCMQAIEGFVLNLLVASGEFSMRLLALDGFYGGFVQAAISDSPRTLIAISGDVQSESVLSNARPNSSSIA